MQQQCPFSVLRIEKSASKKEINEKWSMMVLDHPHVAETLNEARAKALELHDTSECWDARTHKEMHKLRVMELARDLMDYQLKKLTFPGVFGDDYLRDLRKRWTTMEYVEADDIVQYGISDSKQKLADAENLIVGLKNKVKDQQKSADDMAAELADARMLIERLQKENEHHCQRAKDFLRTEQEFAEARVLIESLRTENEHLRHGESDKSEPEAATKKRRVLRSDAFKQAVSDFIRSSLHISSNPRLFIASREIVRLFMQSSDQAHSEHLVATELHTQLSSKFPEIVHTHKGNIRGYRGISLIK